MRKAKNIILLIGIICNSIILLWAVFTGVISLFHTSSGDSLRYIFFNVILPAIIMLLLMLAPVLLFIRNLKNKTGKALPIISVIINCIILSLRLFSLFTPAIPQYIIYNKLGLIDTYFVIFISFLSEGGFLFIFGCLSLIIGSVLSLKKAEKQLGN